MKQRLAHVNSQNRELPYLRSQIKELERFKERDSNSWLSYFL